LELDRNFAFAHGFIGFAKYLLGRASETEFHINEAFRLSPRDTFAFFWMTWVGVAKMQLNADTEAVALQAGLVLDPSFTVRRFVDNVHARGLSDPAFLAGVERFAEGMRLAGVPQG
jgi:hypothetical protein